MRSTKLNLKPLLLPLLGLTLMFGCDDKKDDKKKDDKKADKKAGGDEKAPEPEATPEPEAPTVFTGTDVMGTDVAVPLVGFDLTAAELPGYTMLAPEETEAAPKSPSGFTVRSSRVNFSISVTASDFDLEGSRKLFGILDPDGKVVDESEFHIIYERSGEGGHLFSAGTTVGDKSFKCGTVAGIRPFTRSDIDQSIDACKSITASGGGDAAPADPAAAPEEAPK